jgi:hypothetical protein
MKTMLLAATTVLNLSAGVAYAGDVTARWPTPSLPSSPAS